MQASITDKIIYACSKCNKLFVSEDKAEQCCMCIKCGKVSPGSGYYTCKECIEVARAAGNANYVSRVESNAKLVSYDPVATYHDDADKFFYDVDRDDIFCYLQDIVSDGEELPTYLYVATSYMFKIDMHEAVDRGLEDHYEGAEDHISTKQLEALENMVKEWCIATGLRSYSPTTKEKVLVSEIIELEKFVFEAAKE